MESAEPQRLLLLIFSNLNIEISETYLLIASQTHQVVCRFFSVTETCREIHQKFQKMLQNTFPGRSS